MGYQQAFISICVWPDDGPRALSDDFLRKSVAISSVPPDSNITRNEDKTDSFQILPSSTYDATFFEVPTVSLNKS
jgi:hypothetical protein